MAALYKELQPVDLYKIRMPQPFSDYDRQLLTLFYQPLIGPTAMSFIYDASGQMLSAGTNLNTIIITS